jgi:hypothetical protein
VGEADLPYLLSQTPNETLFAIYQNGDWLAKPERQRQGKGP